MPQKLTGKIAVIVGGTGGCGKSTARMMAEEGATVVVTHRPGKESAAAFLKDLPGKGHAAFPCDVADTKTINALRDSVKAKFGRCDILVNTAGFTQPVPHADLDGLTDDLIDRMFAVNWRGQFATIRAFAPMLKASGDGAIVNVSSLGALLGTGSSIAYGASKAALNQLVRSLSIEDKRRYDRGIVVALHPGTVDTKLSRPFQQAGRDLFQPDRAAVQLLDLIDGLRPADSGKLFAWDGSEIAP